VSAAAVSVERSAAYWPLAQKAEHVWLDCQSGYVCVWADSHYIGRRLQFASAGLRAEMADYSFHDKMSSWRNRNSRDARWYHDENGGGASRCMNNGARVSDLGPGSIFDDGDKMDSLRVYTNSTSC